MLRPMLPEFSEVNMNLMMSFPDGYEPNEAQSFILERIAEGLAAGKTNFIVNAPTATGKSFISKTLANYSASIPAGYEADFKANYFTPSRMEERAPWGTAIVTCTKALQEQYAQLFEGGDVLMGKDNYECTLDPANLCSMGKCAFAPDQAKACLRRGLCPYQRARIRTHCNKCAFYNYSLFLSLPDRPLVKDWLIFDEASEMEDELVKAFTIELSYKSLKYSLSWIPPTPDSGSDSEEYRDWLIRLRDAFRSRMDELYTELRDTKRKKGNSRFDKLCRTYSKVRGTYAELDRVLEVWDLTEWFPIHGADSVKFVPYAVDKLFWSREKVRKSSHRLFMSATIVNVESFMRTFGLDPVDTYYIEAPCSLDPTLAPIVTVGSHYPTYRTKQTVYPAIAKAAVDICNHPQLKGMNGLVHTQSMELLECVRAAAGPGADEEGGRFLFRGRGLSNQDILKIHESTERPTVMVSPSMTHGIDLKGDLGGFQVILKAPYPSIGDPRIARKMKEDPDWYRDRMLSTLIQECGRCNRLKTDRAITFILDSLAAKAIEENLSILPSYFTARYTGRIKEVGTPKEPEGGADAKDADGKDES